MVDRSSFRKSFDMKLDLDAVSDGNNVFLNTEKVKRTLRNYGFDLIKVECDIPILVITEKK